MNYPRPGRSRAMQPCPAIEPVEALA